MIILNILVLLVEALFFYIPLKDIKKIKDFKNKFKLYIGIFLSNIISTLIFGTSIFRYILYILLIFILLKFINKKTRMYDFFIISFLLGFKLLIEFILAMIFYSNLLNLYFIFLFIMEMLCIISAILIKNFLNQIYIFIIKHWNYNKKFYLRYSMLILFNSLILFFIYNLIKIKEVF